MTNKPRKLTNKEQFDIATMVYFIPSDAKTRIYPNDKKKMVDLSSRGIRPQRETKGFKELRIGKTYRDLQITSYCDDVRAGYFTKSELIEGMPPRFREWITKKLKGVPYDEDGYSTAMWVSMYKRGEY